jgi:uncharacterized membrane protein
MDIFYKEKGDGANLLKICIFILGFAPGVRDVLRVTLGV